MECDESLFRERIKSLEKLQWQKIPSLDKDTQKWLGPILQEMIAKEKEREANLHDCHVCVQQYVGKEGCQVFFWKASATRNLHREFLSKIYFVFIYSSFNDCFIAFG